MKPKKRQKLCYNCEGEIDLDVIVCPYCAADLREEKPEQQKGAGPTARPMNAHQMSQSLYPPPFGREVEEPDAVAAPFHSQLPPAAVEEASAEGDSPGRLIGSIVLFTLGVQLLILGLLMALFSSKGALILKWDARLWFLYLFASIPLLIFGYRSISKL